MSNLPSLKFWAFALVLVLAFLLSSCWIDQSQDPIQDSNQSTSMNNSMSFMSQIPTRFTEDEDFLSCTKANVDMCIEEAVLNQEEAWITDCNIFLSEQNRTFCNENLIINEARDTNNSQLCSELSESSQSRCETEVILAQAIEIWDISMCQWITDEFDRIDCNNSIIYSQVYDELDASLCDSLISYEWDDSNFEQEFCRDEVEMMLEMNQDFDDDLIEPDMDESIDMFE